MSASLFPVAIALTRGWLRLYTGYLPMEVVDQRRAEVESDLWEMAHDPDLVPGPGRGLLAMRRLVRGIPDDLAWRFENAAIEEQLLVRRLLALTAAGAIVLCLLTASSLLLKGRRDIAACAAEAAPPQSTAALRHDVIRCAGAFFAAPR